MENNKFNYNGSSVTFLSGKGDVMVNATEMASAFNKQPSDWIRLKSTNEFLIVLEGRRGIPRGGMIRIVTDYLEQILQSKETVTITQIAQDYGMSARKFNQILSEFRIQRKVNGQWILYSPYNTRGYVHSHTTEIKHKNGSTGTVLNTEWRQSGRIFLYEFLKEKGILPMIEK